MAVAVAIAIVVLVLVIVANSRSNDSDNGRSEQPSTMATPELTTSVPSPTPATTPSSTAPIRRKSAVVQVLRRHFRLLDRGDYEGAFALMTYRYRRDNARWPSVRRAADPTIHIVRTDLVSRDGGVARVKLVFYARDRNTTRGSDRRCRRFAGSVRMARVDGRWLYDPDADDLRRSELPRTRCS